MTVTLTRSASGRTERTRMWDVCELKYGGPTVTLKASFAYIGEAYRYALGQGRWVYIRDSLTRGAIRDPQQFTLADVAKAFGTEA